jgi:hypothetical protein
MFVAHEAQVNAGCKMARSVWAASFEVTEVNRPRHEVVPIAG